MSIRCWLYALALGGCLSLGALSGAHGEHHPDTAGHSQTTKASTERPAPAPAQPNTKPNTADISEERCREYERRGVIKDECQQWSMAVSTEKQAITTADLYNLTIIEIILLGAALIISGIATGLSAWAVIDTRSNAKTELRAYLSISSAGINWDPTERRLHIHIRYSNSGSTPARNVRTYEHFEMLPYPIPETHRFAKPTFKEERSTIHPGAAPTVNPVLEEPADEAFVAGYDFRYDPITVYAAAEYEDVFGKSQYTEACWTLNISSEVIRNSADSTEPTKVRVNYAKSYNNST